ncbi:MAG: hypothetical protein HY774_26675 [Acidobacteria bacterium]|nr:hypothetical protein [Acidobacteriota bacterium]
MKHTVHLADLQEKKGEPTPYCAVQPFQLSSSPGFQSALVWLEHPLNLVNFPEVLSAAVLLASPSCRVHFSRLTGPPSVPIVGPLVRRVGPHRALEYLLTGVELSAEEAFQARLIDGVMSAETFETWINQVLVLSPQSRELAFEMVHLQRSASQSAAEAAERYGFALAFALPDAAEGIKAFLEKRHPHFQMKNE